MIKMDPRNFLDYFNKKMIICKLTYLSRLGLKENNAEHHINEGAQKINQMAGKSTCCA